MSSANVFLTIPLQEKIVVHPSSLSRDVHHVILNRLRSKFEGICSHYGYIREGSIHVSHFSHGRVRAFSLNGDVEFTVDFKADICNPCKGSILKARVVNINRFGALAEVSIEQSDGMSRQVIMDIIIPRIQMSVILDKNIEKDDTARIDALQIGTQVCVEVLGKRFQLNDKKLSVLGRLTDSVSTEAAASGIGNIVCSPRDNDNDSDVSDPEEIAEDEFSIEDDDENEDKSAIVKGDDEFSDDLEELNDVDVDSDSNYESDGSDA